jgi:hypothetical protein
MSIDTLAKRASCFAVALPPLRVYLPTGGIDTPTKRGQALGLYSRGTGGPYLGIRQTHATECAHYDGETVPVEVRLDNIPVTLGALVPIDVESITWTLLRSYKGRYVIVPGHRDVALDVDEVMFGALQSWEHDARGYNFRHVIEDTELAPIASYVAKYDFQLVNGGSFVVRRRFDYLTEPEYDAGYIAGETP